MAQLQSPILKTRQNGGKREECNAIQWSSLLLHESWSCLVLNAGTFLLLLLLLHCWPLFLQLYIWIAQWYQRLFSSHVNGGFTWITDSPLPQFQIHEILIYQQRSNLKARLVWELCFINIYKNFAFFFYFVFPVFNSINLVSRIVNFILGV